MVQYFHKKKSQVLKSGDLGGYGVSPNRGNSLPEKISVVRKHDVQTFTDLNTIKFHG